MPSALIRKICEPPSLVSVTASRRPSGDHAGALLLPRKFASTCRCPVASRLHVDDGLLVLERHVGDPRAVGRPRAATAAARSTPTIVCGLPPSASATMQLEAAALLGDVRDARREHAGVAGELLVDDVGDLVRRGAELRRRDHVGHRGQLRLLDRVDQREAHLDAAVGQRAHRPDHDGVGAARAEIAELARPRRGSAAARCRRRSTSRNRPLRCRSAATMPEMPSGQVDSLSNGTIAMGTVVPAPPTISMVSCARAGATARTRNARAAKIRRRKSILCEAVLSLACDRDVVGAPRRS